LEVLRLHIAGFLEVEEVVPLEPGIVPPMAAGTWVVAIWGCYFFPYINKGSPPLENASHTSPLHLFQTLHSPSSSFSIFPFQFLSPHYFIIIIFLGSIWVLLF